MPPFLQLLESSYQEALAPWAPSLHFRVLVWTEAGRSHWVGSIQSRGSPLSPGHRPTPRVGRELEWEEQGLVAYLGWGPG